MVEAPRRELLITRYASPEMVDICSPARRIRLWRDLWIALAEAEHELGLPITKAQIEDMRKHREPINWDVADQLEREQRHEVMAHVHAYGAQAKKAAGIIHLGATSAFVMDNADLIMLRDGVNLVMGKVAAAVDRLAAFAKKERDTVTLAYTHGQPAQPTTVGKRACLWIQDFAMDLQRLEFEKDGLRFLGVKGATGTQDSFLKLFEGDVGKVLELDRRVTAKMGFPGSFPVSGQTYPRKVDTRIVTALANVGESSAKFANDIRLLQSAFEVYEPREGTQIGSSAMPYKLNPMRSERIVALARYVVNLVGNCYDTAGSQWLERSLDDSANRRFVLPHALLVVDGIVDLVINVAAGLKVQHALINKKLERELPFLQTEEILMWAVCGGGNRQDLHERIRKHSEDVMRQVREKGAPNDLLARIRKDEAFSAVPPRYLVRTDPSRLVGMAREQVDACLKGTVNPIRRRYKSALSTRPKIRV